MRNKFIILLFLGLFFDLHADGIKSITINEIGERDVAWPSLIINTHALKQGVQFDGVWFFYRYAVDETTFDEIMDFINDNRELFREILPYKESGIYTYGPYGSVGLFIENEGDAYYRYLVERRASALFFYGLLEIIRSKGNYDELADRLEQDIMHFGFNRIIGNYINN